MRQLPIPGPIRPTAPFKEGDGYVLIRPAPGRQKLRDGVTYLVRTDVSGSIALQLPISGRVTIIDDGGSADSNNIAVYPYPGFSIVTGGVNEELVMDIARERREFNLRQNAKVWSVA